ncbi:hexokinase [Apiospora arundinis]
MEGLGAAGSIVGILGFIGQSIAGIAALQKFFEDYKNSPGIANKLNREMTKLEASLMDVEAVVQLLRKQSWGELAGAVKVNIATLQHLTKHCSHDIATWVQVTAGLDPKQKSGFKAFFQKVKLAMSGPDKVRSFEADVSRHCQNISNALGTLSL